MARMSEFPEIQYSPGQRQRPRRPRGVGRLSAAIALAALGGLAAIVAMSILGWLPALESSVGVGPQAASTPVAPAAVPAENGIGAQAKTWGVADCLGRITTLSDFLTKGATAHWLPTRGAGDANKEMFAATIAARETSSGLAGISNLYATPVAGGHCNAAYESTVYLPEPCSQAHEHVFPRFLTRLDLQGDVAEAFSTVDGSARLFLLPAGDSGCVAVKTEAFY